MHFSLLVFSSRMQRTLAAAGMLPRQAQSLVLRVSERPFAFALEGDTQRTHVTAFWFRNTAPDPSLFQQVQQPNAWPHATETSMKLKGVFDMSMQSCAEHGAAKPQVLVMRAAARPCRMHFAQELC